MPTPVRQLIDTFRREVDDPYEPGGSAQQPDEHSLWKDEEITGYLIEAQNELSRRILHFTATKQISFVAGTEKVDYPDGYLDLRAAYLIDGANRTELPRRNFDEMEAVIRSDYGVQGGSNWLTDTGAPQVLVTDVETDSFRFAPIPEKGGTVMLVYYRYPLPRFVGTTGQIEYADPQYIRAILHWMKNLAYAKQDAETLDLQRSQQFEAKFFAAAQDLAGEDKRARRRPGTVAYGGL